MSAYADSLFLPRYRDARAQFIDAARRAGWQQEHHHHPQTGSAGEALAVDVAVGGNPRADTLLLCSSGVHGVEGIAGSACQRLLLQQAAASAWPLPANLKIVLVHALNPYGFSHWRRTNENNVDLNRNFVDFAAALPQHPDYATLHECLFAGEIDENEQISGPLGDYIQQHGMAKFQEVLARGQYSHADGLFYGGHEPQWSRRVFEKILAQQLACITRVAFLDIHTGLGPAGHGELIFNGGTDSPDYQLTRTVFGDDVTASQSGTAVATYSSGLILNAFNPYKAACSVASATLEYGTAGFGEVVNALRAECRLRCQNRHQDEDALKRVKQRLLAAFFVDRENWRQAVLARFEQVMGCAIDNLGSE